MAGKLNPDRAQGLLTSVASKQNTWCSDDEFVSTPILTPVFAPQNTYGN
jgi:hypothetical protein